MWSRHVYIYSLNIIYIYIGVCVYVAMFLDTDHDITEGGSREDIDPHIWSPKSKLVPQ